LATFFDGGIKKENAEYIIRGSFESKLINLRRGHGFRLKIGHLHLVSGQIQSCIDSRWHSYVMRTLNSNDFSEVLKLYDLGIDHLESPDLLWRYPDEKVADFLTDQAVTAGVFVDQRLVGFRVLYFHDADDLDNPLHSVGLHHELAAHSALCVVHPEFRGNSLQKQMGIHILEAAKKMRAFGNFCSVVSPQNYASMKDKFSLNMLIVKLAPKFSGIWRYIFYQNMNQAWQVDTTDIIFVLSYEYMEQIRLLEQGYYGFRFAENHGHTGVYFGKLARLNPSEEEVTA
jgi:hypothetical protein